MPIDASIYQQIKPFEMPSYADSQAKAMTLSNMGLQQKQAMQQMDRQQRVGEREDKDAAYADQMRTRSIVGNAIDSVLSAPPEARPGLYQQKRNELIQAGLMGEQDAPPEYDEPKLQFIQGEFNRSEEGMKKQMNALKMDSGRLDMDKTRAEIRALNRKGTSGDDPLARQMAMVDYKEMVDQRKKDAEMQRYSQVGGWKLGEGATPTLDDAKKFKGGASAARALMGNLNEYQELLRNNGSELGGKTAQRMESLVRDIQLSAKNEDLYSLGVLTGPDLALLEEIVGQAPTGIMAKLNPFSSGKANNKAQQFREMVNTRLNAKAKTYGFEPQDEWRALAQGGRPKQSAGSGMGGESAYAADRAPAPKHGTVEEGYVFMGGDPGDKKNWKAK